MRFFPREGTVRRLTFLGALALPALLRGAPWVVITEIHYNPPEGEEQEFVEILNREPPRVDISGWRIEGEIDFVFPEGTMLQPGEHAVIAKSPTAIRRKHPRAGRVLGPFSGKLDNKGGRIDLRNAAGARVSEVRYENGGKWPSVPDGTGHTLTIRDPLFDPSDAASWVASARLGGTPGARNFVRAKVEGTPILKKGEEWSYWKGLEAPAPAWKDPGFNAAGWLKGAMGIGYDDGDDATELTDMRGSYFSVFTRRVFTAAASPPGARLILRVDYDDGFIAYLNGKEVARAGMGEPGTEVPHDEPASSRHEAGVGVEFELGPAAKLLAAGQNVFAVQVHNDDLNSSDLSISVELESRKPPDDIRKEARPLLNEVVLGPGATGPSFVEIYNAGSAEVDLGGSFLTDDPKSLRKLKIPGPAVLAPGKFLVIGEKEIAGKLAPRAGEVFLALTAAEGDRVLDLVRFAGAGDSPDGDSKKKGAGKKDKDGAGKESKGPIGPHHGRFPDGGRKAGFLDPPTPGAPNKAPSTADLVINEIMYHPLWGEELEYLEILNRGSNPASLDGFRITGGVRHAFAAGTSIPPGGFLLVAKDPDALAKKYGIPREKIAGPFRGSLSNRGEEVTLRDARGNVADQVEYADGRPWPHWADGLGASLELTDASLDNSIPAAWAPSDDRSKAKWQTFTYAKDHKIFNTRHNIPELQVLLLNEGECLIDDFRLRGERDFVADGNFERGAPSWNARGTHERSGVQQGDAAQGKACYRLVAEGRGNGRHNNISIDIPAGLQPGKRYQVSFRAKWQRGAMVLLTRTGGQGVAKAHRLTPPEKLGTPGAENSTKTTKTPPVIAPPHQDPVAPSTGDPVTFATRISAPSKVASASIHYRPESASEWSEARLADDGRPPDLAAGDGVWSGELPALPAGMVEFHITAKDSGGMEGGWPAGGSGNAAIYAVGIIPSSKFPTYTVLMSDAEWQAAAARPPLSNRLANATLVYGDSRIFYQVGVRRRGSPFTRSRGRNWRIVFGTETLDGRGSLTLDGQSGDGTNLSERLTYWSAGELHAPNVRQQYVYFRIPGQEEGIYEDVEKIDGGFLASWFEPEEAKDGEDPEPASKKKALPAGEAEEGGNLHKVDDYFELFANGGQDYDEAELDFKSADPEDYRWNFPPRANGPTEDFMPLLKLIQLFDPRATPDKAFLERVEKAVDVDEWLRVLAARTLCYDWDTLGLTRGKNSMLYLSPADGRWRLLPWDCDLSWQTTNVRAPLFSNKFAGIRRMLDYPPYRRRFIGYVAYLAERKLEPAAFARVLEDLHAYSGARTDPWRDFARERRTFVLSQVPDIPFQLVDAKRVDRAKEPDILRATGTAPIVAMRFRLVGPGKAAGDAEELRRSEGVVRFIDEARWSAEIPIGPEGGDAVLQALDFGGTEVASAPVKVRARKGALPLPERPTAPSVDLAARDVKGGEEPALPGESPAGEKESEPAPAVEVAAADPAPDASGRGAGTEAPAATEVSTATARTSPEAAKKQPKRDAALLDEEAAILRDMEEEERRARGETDEEPSAAAKTVERNPSSGADGEEAKSPEPPPEPEPAAAGTAGSATPAGETGGGIPWSFLIPAALLLAGVQAALILISRRRRAAREGAPRRAANPAAETEVLTRQVTARDATVAALAALGSTRFEEAVKALRRLSKEAEIEPLLEALGDPRPTPFQKIRRASDGSFTAVSSQAGAGIRIRHVAALLLGETLGKPPVPRPTRADWEALWKASRERVTPSRTPLPRVRGAVDTPRAPGPT